MFKGPSNLCTLSRSLIPPNVYQNYRHASIKAGVARGLRASGVDPATSRQLKRTTSRRGLDTGASGQWKDSTRSPRRPQPSAPVSTRPRDRAQRTSFAAPDRTRRPSSARSESSRYPSQDREGFSRSVSRDRRSTGSFSARGHSSQYSSRDQDRSQRTGFASPDRDRRPSSSYSESRRDPYQDRVRSQRTNTASFDGDRRHSFARNNSPQYSDQDQDDSPRFSQDRRTRSDSAPSSSYAERSSASRTPHPFPVPYSTATSVFVPGRRTTESILLAARRQTYNLYVSSSSRSATSVRQLESLANSRRCPVKYVSQDYIDRVLTTLKMGMVVNDGVLLECSELTYTPIDGLGKHDAASQNFKIVSKRSHRPQSIGCEEQGARWRGPLLLWLHEVVNTQNIAALYRSAIYFGIDAVILTERGTGRIQPSALRASAGAVEFLPTLIVSDPKAFMTDSKRAGWRFMGAMPPAKGKDSKKIDVVARDSPLGDRQPSVIVLGNEDQGLSSQIKDACDAAVTIPAAGDRAARAGVDSLNVSVAGSLLFSRLLQKPRQIEKERESMQDRLPSGETGRLF